jgi:hypothetical protein
MASAADGLGAQSVAAEWLRLPLPCTQALGGEGAGKEIYREQRSIHCPTLEERKARARWWWWADEKWETRCDRPRQLNYDNHLVVSGG